MSGDRRDEPIELVERATGDDAIDLGYSAVARSGKTKSGATPPSGGSSTKPPAKPIARAQDDKDSKQQR